VTDSLFDEPLEIVDRSSLELALVCPMQMHLKRETAGVVGMAAAVGEACHVAISKTVQHYIDSIDAGDMVRPSDLADRLNLELLHSRPDVQPEAIEACRASVWAIARTLHDTDPDNILRFDGGQGKRSGQMAWDARDGFRVTTEFDLLRATESVQKLREDDWKSGWGMHTTESVARSFQFTLHAVLVFENFPAVQQLDVVVWNLRTGRPLPSVQFYRSKLQQYQALIQSAVDVWIEHDTNAIERVPCWPATEKCRICDVAARCPSYSRPVPLDDSEAFTAMIAVEANLKARQDDLAARVVKNGKPILSPDGKEEFGKFGAEKPTQTWKVRKSNKGDV